MCVFRCVEILISEQFRRYKEKLQNIQELEYAEALAVSQLKLKRQNTVRAWGVVGRPWGLWGVGHLHNLMTAKAIMLKILQRNI